MEVLTGHWIWTEAGDSLFLDCIIYVASNLFLPFLFFFLTGVGAVKRNLVTAVCAQGWSEVLYPKRYWIRHWPTSCCDQQLRTIFSQHGEKRQSWDGQVRHSVCNLVLPPPFMSHYSASGGCFVRLKGASHRSLIGWRLPLVQGVVNGTNHSVCKMPLIW